MYTQDVPMYTYGKQFWSIYTFKFYVEVTYLLASISMIQGVNELLCFQQKFLEWSQTTLKTSLPFSLTLHEL